MAKTQNKVSAGNEFTVRLLPLDFISIFGITGNIEIFLYDEKNVTLGQARIELNQNSKNCCAISYTNKLISSNFNNANTLIMFYQGCQSLDERLARLPIFCKVNYQMKTMVEGERSDCFACGKLATSTGKVTIISNIKYGPQKTLAEFIVNNRKPSVSFGLTNKEKNPALEVIARSLSVSKDQKCGENQQKVNSNIFDPIYLSTNIQNIEYVLNAEWLFSST